MSGNDSSNDDLVMGRTNHAQDPTRLFANEDGHRWGDDLGDHSGPVLDVQTGEMARPGEVPPSVTPYVRSRDPWLLERGRLFCPGLTPIAARLGDWLVWTWERIGRQKGIADRWR